MHTIKAVQRKGVEEQQSKLREDQRRFGDASSLSQLIRLLHNATPTEKIQLKQALEGDVTNE